ncbi:MAG TPA: hypothetical protein PKV72_00110 [Candidatus Peribacteria bacterium]|nr:hypothetical protein [Candidatus Peribacteria bacterium]
MFGEFSLATSRGRSNQFATPALMQLEDRTTPAPMPTKVVPLNMGAVGCDAYTPVVYSWTNKADPYVLMLVSPDFHGTFAIYASTSQGLVVQENIRPVNGYFVPFIFPQGGGTDLVVLAKADEPYQGFVPYLLYGTLGFFYANCPPEAHQPAPAAAPPASPPPYVPPQTELSISSIFLDAQPGPGLEEVGRFAIGVGPATVETVEFRDTQGGFAGVIGSTVQLRRYDEAIGASGPALGSATVVDASTLRVTGIHAVFQTSQQFTLSLDLNVPVQLESARAYGTH